ncbi:MAG: AlpA family phage regulatory protein [Cellvibrionales bacterium]|nr:MAG: AlpA family phage regulatory protein [Cellvibrionales bacterium]
MSIVHFADCVAGIQRFTVAPRPTHPTQNFWKMIMELLRNPDVRSRFGVRSASSIYNLMNEGLLTPAIVLGPRLSGWPRHEVEAIVAARTAGFSKDRVRQLVKDLIGAREVRAEQAIKAALATVGGAV